MDKTRIVSFLLAVATLLSAACSSTKVPGVWVTQDTGTGDSFYSANFVDENVGWLNGQSGREPSEDNDNANKKAKPRKPGEKVEDPLKANQGFEVLQTTDGGQTWRQIPDQFKNKIRSVWFVDPQHGWALTIDRSILTSTDGGAIWTIQRKAGKVKLKLLGNRREPELEQPEQIEQIHFIDRLHGWAWAAGERMNTRSSRESCSPLLTVVRTGTRFPTRSIKTHQPCSFSMQIMGGPAPWAPAFTRRATPGSTGPGLRRSFPKMSSERSSLPRQTTAGSSDAADE